MHKISGDDREKSGVSWRAYYSRYRRPLEPWEVRGDNSERTHTGKGNMRSKFLFETGKYGRKTVDRFAWLENTGVANQRSGKSEREKLELAPFATNMLRNPYARLLASPIRECAFTDARLPRELMLDFHLIERDDLLADIRTDAKQQLLPLSLAAGLIAKKVKTSDLTPEEQALRDRWDRERLSYVPGQRASYLGMRKDIVEKVANSEKDKVMHLALTSRTRDRVMSKSGADVGMRQDMATVVLTGLRRLLWKRLGYFVRDKAGKPDDLPGLLQALPRDSGVKRVHELRNVGCVVRLKPSTSQEFVADPAMPSSLTIRKTNRARWREEDRQKEQIILAADPPPEAIERTEQYEQSGDVVAKPFEFIREVEPDPTIGGESEHVWVEPDETDALDAQGEELAGTVGSETTRMAEVEIAQWTEIELPKQTPYLMGIRPLPPPARPSDLYFPTIRYRNTRIPLYSLPQLLGDEICRRLLEDSVFKDTEYLAIQHNRGLLTVHQLLTKLQAYVATTKDRTLRI